MKSIRNLRGLVMTAFSVAALTTGQSVFAAGSHDGGHGHSKTEKGHGEHGHGNHGHGSHGHGERPDIGHPGNAADVSRTVEIIMRDNLFEPATLSIREGETVRFTVINKGQFVHEFNIATAAMHKSHQSEMVGMMEKGILGMDKVHHDRMAAAGMHHDHANSVLLEPGQSGEVIWKFDTHAKLEFACNVPGHYESGMAGPIRLHH